LKKGLNKKLLGKIIYI